MNKRIFISLFLLFAFLSLSAVSASDLNESQTLESNDVEITAAQDSNVLSSQNELSGAFLMIDNDADTENVYVGELVTWTLTADNLGPHIAKNTKVYNQLPEGLQYLYHSSTKGVFDPQTGIWDIGDLKSEDGPVYLHITCKAITSGEKVNKAWITSDTKNLNIKDYEEEEMDVLDYENIYENHDNIKNEVPILKSAGNPVFLILMCLFLIFTNVVVRR
ncbi:DUF11 domain-containing protein [uncultured Methanobrevibacter sp.]|uniref:DUF11 domain-containing protein n=1 Tax=uncultured Methanobrevibacter sp. TaxID=253161 RepID=UPI0025CD53E6|nr:DUF11 domain-containing protein [uncultured Methanobrevibacter sp.]